MSACCEFVRHLFGWVAYHSGHRPRVMSSAMASVQLYPRRGRSVVAEPLNEEKEA